MIGIFDSGSGGLTVLEKIIEESPKSDIVYFGDLNNMPYGNRSNEELEKLTTNAVSTLLIYKSDIIVSACNSVSESVLKTGRQITSEVGIVEMTKPTAEALHKNSGKILLLATPATVKSRVYHKAFGRYDREIDALPVPDLAQAIEENSLGDCEKIIEALIPYVREVNPDTIILGCTQFPLAQSIFDRVFREYQIKVCNPAEFVAGAVTQKYKNAGKGSLQFLLSRDSAVFRERVSRMFARKPHKVNIV